MGGGDGVGVVEEECACMPALVCSARIVQTVPSNQHCLHPDPPPPPVTGPQPTGCTEDMCESSWAPRMLNPLDPADAMLLP